MKPQKKTLPQIMACIIKASMAANDVTVDRLADAVGVHRNTVSRDLSDPVGMQVGRMSLYLAALGIDIAPGLDVLAAGMAHSITG